MTRARAVLASAALVAVAVVGAWMLGRPRQPPRIRATLSLIETLTGDTTGYARASGARVFRFPEDHGAHPSFRTEWWYLTGNLHTEDGRRLGYQLALFRSALSPDAPEGDGGWSTRQAWMAHLALTDPDGSGFRAFERFSREALGLAGASADPFRVWLEDWEIRSAPGAAGGVPGFPAEVRAAQDDVVLELRLEPDKGVVLHGEGGLHWKDPAGASASYYYSLPRLGTTGTVRVGGERLPVEGLSWLDREWSTSSLPEGVSGWDWMGLQLDDGRDLMVYRLRSRGGAERLRGGTLVERDGRAVPLAAEDLELGVLSRWRSPLDGAEYPSVWRVRVPSAGLDLFVHPLVPAQELDLSYRYWEGAVDVKANAAGTAGRGYLEMTGYDGDPGPPPSGPGDAAARRFPENPRDP